MRLIGATILVGLVITVSNCGKGDDDSGGSSNSTGTIEVLAEQNGDTFEGAFVAGAEETQQMLLPEDSGLSGTSVSIPPGALAIDTVISVQEEEDIATELVAALDEDNEVVDAGQAVSVKPTVAQNALSSLTVGVPVPANVTENSDNLSVVWATEDAETGDTETAILPNGELTLQILNFEDEDGDEETTLWLLVSGLSLEFQTTKFGTFQAVLLKNPVAKKLTAGSDDDKTDDKPEPKFCEENSEKALDDLGEGTAEKPFLLCTEAQLILASAAGNKHFRLEQDITVSSSFLGFGIAEPFTGTFDGNGFAIKGLMIQKETSEAGEDSVNNYAGFINQLGHNGVVKNLTFKDSSISTYRYACIAVGRNIGGKIINVHTTGNVEGYNGIGGIVGGNYSTSETYGVVERSSSSANVTGVGDFSGVGGIAGNNGSAKILNSFYHGGTIDGGSGYAGGVAFSHWIETSTDDGKGRESTNQFAIQQ